MCIRDRRYTEARLKKIGEEMMQDLYKMCIRDSYITVHTGEAALFKFLLEHTYHGYIQLTIH